LLIDSETPDSGTSRKAIYAGRRLIRLFLGRFLFAEVAVSRMCSEGHQDSQKAEYCDGCDIVRGTESVKMGKPRNERWSQSAEHCVGYVVGEGNAGEPDCRGKCADHNNRSQY
jgi:hypothetical protein